MLYCHNPACQTPNPEGNRFCQNCRTPLIWRYLWGVGSDRKPGEVVADRYLCKSPHVFLDTKPGYLPNLAAELPEQYTGYLRLSPWRLHVPQVYDWIEEPASLLLLEQAPLQTTSTQEPQLYPLLTAAWPAANALRQLNWLWQMASLWQPLSGEQATASLLQPDLLRVEGSILRLVELRQGNGTLQQLGHLWQSWGAIAQPEISEFLQPLCQQLIQTEIYNVELLIDFLDRAIARLGQNQTRHIQTATRTDQGPTRQRNEDACYPPSGTVQTLLSAADPLVVVCDGIGGHEGGDVASNLAIAAIQQQINSLDLISPNATTLMVELEKAACLANDQISRRNDSEQRQDRMRMGTTLVMGLLRGHELYITHVGDSRAYWITRHGCHQVTLDDDVASREVRLGYCTYAQALQHPGSGSLVQALGMSASNLLYPNVQRFILDEDGVFLLCSDGLSDGDRVDEYWETEILPMLDGKTDIETVSKRLIDIGNTQNGHDNVTVGLIYVQVAPTDSFTPVSAIEAPALSDKTLVSQPVGTHPLGSAPFNSEPSATRISQPNSQPNLSSSAPTPTTQVLPRQRRSSIPLLLGIGGLLGLAGLLGIFFFFPTGRQAIAPSPAPSPTPIPTASSDSNTLATGALVQLDSNQLPLPTLPLLNEPTRESAANAPTSPLPTPSAIGSLAKGSILEVVSKRSTTQQGQWLQFRVCSTPAAEAATAVGVGQKGWIRESEIKAWVKPVQLTPEQQGVCQKATPSIAPTVGPSVAPSLELPLEQAPDGISPIPLPSTSP
jgi:serine/threonine protein phosphatase PrpC